MKYDQAQGGGGGGGGWGVGGGGGFRGFEPPLKNNLKQFDPKYKIIS